VWPTRRREPILYFGVSALAAIFDWSGLGRATQMKMFLLGVMVAFTPSLLILAWTLRRSFPNPHALINAIKAYFRPPDRRPARHERDTVS
jgi:hypothetical protein